MVNEIADAMNTLKKIMQDDPDYARVWYANIFCCHTDAGVKCDKARDGAKRFMKLCFDVEIVGE